MRYIDLDNGVKMPIIGLGTWKSEPSEVYTAVRWALKLGYKHFDCAAVYNNEEAIGQAISDAIKEDGLKREDIFITSKLWNNAHKPEDVLSAYQEILARLKVSYLDLFLMHWPVAQKKNAIMPLTPEDMVSLSEIPLADTWQAMEDIYRQGKVRAIGVSNFGEKNLTSLMMTSQINPMINQVECHPYFPQNELWDFCKKNMIAMTAYSPLGSGISELFDDEILRGIANKLNCTPAQVMLAWNMERGIAVIPKSVEEKYLRENLSALNLKLDAEDMALIDNIGKKMRILSGDVFAIGAYKGMDIFA